MKSGFALSRYLMKYMGSKSRIAKYIVPIIQDKIDTHNIQTYIEPFAGGMNIIDKINCKNKIASDNNEFLIELFQHKDELNILPEFVTKEQYSKYRQVYHDMDFSKFPKWYIGAIGFLASYNGRFFDGGYAGIVHTKTGTERNYYDEAKRNLLEQIPQLKDIHFQYGDYAELYSDITNCLLYCDIPYKDTKQYGTSKNFDYNRFWNWATKMNKNNIIIVSEHRAPDNWNCIWEQTVTRTIDNTKRIKATEKLFTLGE